MTEVTPHPLKTQGFHHFLILLFYDHPAYETAFVLLEEPPMSVKIPPWAIRLVLDLPGLEKAKQEAAEEYPDMIDWDELPQL